MEISLTVVLQALIGAGAGALGAYVAIRSDLAHLKARVDMLHEATSMAHKRIDSMLNK